jgi:hypothetical protein
MDTLARKIPRRRLEIFNETRLTVFKPYSPAAADAPFVLLKNGVPLIHW